MRLFAHLVLVALLAPGVAFAAGVREDAIGIEFPQRLGDFTLKGRTQFPNKADGATTVYEGSDVRGAIYVYNAGLAEVPTGVGSPVIHRHFQQTAAALQQAGRESAGTVTPARGSTISAFPGCGPQFMWRADRISMEGNAVVSRTYLAGFQNHFVKLRVTHPSDASSVADDFVQKVRRVLGKC